MSEPAVSYDFQQLQQVPPPPRDAPARLLAQARGEAEQITEQARASGYADGHAAGMRDAQAQTAAAAEALAEALQKLGRERVELAAAVEREAIDFGLAVAEKVLAGALEARPELVVDVVQGGLRRVAGQRTITVLLNPADLVSVRAALGELQGQLGSADVCDLQGDQRVERGGAIVRTAEGEVDARVRTQLERAREVAVAELGRDRDPAESS